MRSWVKARSYWASAPKRLNRKVPCGVVGFFARRLEKVYSSNQV